jgi:hypothetical protein
VSRVAITLDEHALAELSRRAQANGEPAARTAARMVRDGLLSTHAHPAGEQPTPEDAGQRARGDGGGLPGWLEPPGERERWRRELWATVVGLAERYPRVFSKLVADWWTDRQLVEVLGALGAWRSQLDAGEYPDPRAELLFHDRLELLDRQLTQTGDPTAARFSGGPPPSEWLA